MVVQTAATGRNTGRYRTPAIMGLARLLDQQVRDRPGARALIVNGDRVELSYRALATLAENVAVRLGDAGLRPGDLIGLICANNAEFVVALLGAAQAGVVVAPLDPALPEQQLAARLEAAGARAVVVGPGMVGEAPDALGQTPAWPLRVEIPRRGTATVTLDTGAGAAERLQGAARDLSDQDALVLFTAGTTDLPKMVPLTHTNVAASVQGICATYELGPADATVAVMPLFHGHGLFAALLATLASGGCVLLPERGRFTAHSFWEDVLAAAATWFTAVPTIHEILLERSAREYPGPQAVPLRFVRSCSAPLNTATQRALERTFGAPLLSAYGMTETAHQATSEPLPQDGGLRNGSVGRSSGVDLRVVDRDGRPCPVGTEGEVWVHGPTVTRGYLANPADTAKSFRDGGFCTGDLGTLGEDGYLVLTGRIKNLINRGGEKISPEHVEDILAGCPGVTEAAVFAVPDAIYGQRVGAAVVVRAGDSLGSEQILKWCRDQLAAFEVPDRIEIVADLPHTAKGGLDRRAVEARYAQ